MNMFCGTQNIVRKSLPRSIGNLPISLSEADLYHVLSMAEYRTYEWDRIRCFRRLRFQELASSHGLRFPAEL